jgi:presequence protease
MEIAMEKREAEMPESCLSPGEIIHGFAVEGVVPLTEIRCMAYCLKHTRSGARLIHLHARDGENLLAIAFRTPPPDDTGLPHILEHTVLCGSRRYPVKDPFVELLKTSLATFLNAITYPDKTVYPCASMNEKDFFNLAGVYCDAVFHPLILPEHFKQEGHHFDFEDRADPASALAIRGIVYNEMKGAFSDLDGMIGYHCHRLFPDNAYGRISGGDPAAIPSLTYKDFSDFHRHYYHPSNSYIFIYGDIPTEKHVAFLNDQYLHAFDRLDIDTTIALQSRWPAPRRHTHPYPASPKDRPDEKTAVVMTLFTNEITDVECTLTMHILEHYLLSNAASPLRRALVDSRLGEDLTHSGYGDYQRDTVFSVGLKGAAPDKARTLETLVLETCRRVADEGLDRRKVEAAFHQLELETRDIGSMYPLRLMERVYDSWIYDGDPLFMLERGQHLADLRAKYENTPRYFEKQLMTLVVENPHYLVLTLVPDSALQSERNEALVSEMADTKSRMSEEQIADIAREAERLEALQNEPNSPETLATLPQLKLTDVSPHPMDIDTDVERVAQRPFLTTRVFTNGLNFLRLGIDASGLGDELIDFLPLYAEALRKMGTDEDDYLAMAEREAETTGGVCVSVSGAGRFSNPDHVQPFLFADSNALDAKLPEMVRFLTDRITKTDFSDLERLKTVILQSRVQRHSGIVPAGNRYAVLHAQRRLSRNGELAERLGGVYQTRMLDTLANELDDRLEAVSAKLSAIHGRLRERGRFVASFVGTRRGADIARGWYEQFLGGFHNEAAPVESATFTAEAGAREGIALPAEVAFAAQAFRAVPASDPLAPALAVLAQALSFGYLWNEVRAKRGAYGCSASYNQANGMFSFASYRDPFICETLDTYTGVLEHVEHDMDLSADAVEQAVIGSVRTLDHPIRPGSAVRNALSRYLAEIDDEVRQAYRSRLLSLSADDIRRASEDVLRPGLAAGTVCVISSRKKLEAANEHLGASLLAVSDL